MPFTGASLVAQIVKILPAGQETQVQSLSQKDPLEKEMATHSSILAWRIPWTVQSWGGKESDTTEHTYVPFTPGPKKPNFSLSEVHLEVGFIVVQILWVSCFLLYKTINANIL